MDPYFLWAIVLAAVLIPAIKFLTKKPPAVDEPPAPEQPGEPETLTVGEGIYVRGRGPMTAARMVIPPPARRKGRPVLSRKLWWAMALPAALFALSWIVVVPTKHVAIVTRFGTPGHVYNNGLGFKTPLDQQHIFDASLQTEHYSAEKDADGPRITVRLSIGTEGFLTVTDQWKLTDGPKFEEVFLNYKKPNRIKIDLVRRLLQQALNDEFVDFNPFDAIKTAANGQPQIANVLDDRGQRALSRLQIELAPKGVDFQSLVVSNIQYPDSTQKELDAKSAEYGKTQTALQAIETAKAQALAIEELNRIKPTGSTLIQFCINVTKEMAMAGHVPSSGWNCFGPSNVAITAQ